MRLLSLTKFFTFFLFSLSLTVWAQLVPEKPALLYPIYDEADLLSAQEEDLLNQKLIKFYDSSSTEISVIIIPTTKGEDVNYLATIYGEKWKIGEKEQDNGIVFLIATEDRRFSIQQGRGVERYLTASVAGQILDYIVTPSFKQGNYYQGIDRGTTALMEVVEGKFKPVAKSPKSGGAPFRTLIVIFFIILFLSFFFRNRGGGRNDDDDDVILSRRGRRTYPGGFFPFPGSFGGGGFGGGGFGGGSGGGFGGFGGGGSFGGGGASGGW